MLRFHPTFCLRSGKPFNTKQNARIGRQSVLDLYIFAFIVVAVSVGRCLGRLLGPSGNATQDKLADSDRCDHALATTKIALCASAFSCFGTHSSALVKKVHVWLETLTVDV